MKCTICCSGWEVKDDENFCGWCGNPTLDFKVEFIGETPLIYADESIEEPYIFNINIINSGIIPVTIEKPQIEGL
jgi:hypothetical protein